jgi:hypothetical protein
VSLAVCSSCFDVTSHLVKQPFNNPALFVNISDAWTEPDNGAFGKFEGNGTQYKLPDLGLHINNFDTGTGNDFLAELMTSVTSADPRLSINMKDSQTLLTTFTVLRADQDFRTGAKKWESAPRPTATECGLFLCLKAYNSSVVQGNLTEIVVAETSQRVAESWMPNWTEIKDNSGFNITNLTALGTPRWNPLYQPNYVPRYDFQLDTSGFPKAWYPTNATFNVSQNGADSIVAFLSSLLPLNNSSPASILASTPGANGPNPPSVYHDSGGVSFSLDTLQPLYESENLTETFDTLARSLTIVFREAQGNFHSGAATQWVIHYHIRWAFLAVPIAFVISKYPIAYRSLSS